MWFTRVSIANPVMAVMVMLAFVVLGLFSYQRLKVDQFPDIDFPTVVVVVEYPGASPEIVESEVTRKVEESVNTIAGISQLYSRSYEGSSVVIIQFNLDINGRKAADDVREKLAIVKTGFREEVKEPRVTRFDPSSRPVFTLALTSPDGSRSVQELTTFADQVLKKRLENVRGVGSVTLVGGVRREVNVYLRPRSLEAYGVGVDAVMGAVRTENQDLPAGALRSREAERTVQIMGRVRQPDELRQVIVARRNGQPVRLGQVAEVVDGPEELESLALYNGQRVLALDVQKSQGENTIDVVEGLKQVTDAMRAQLPRGMAVEVLRDNARPIRVSVSNVRQTLLEGALLTIGIVFLFLNSWRSTVITGLTLPISLVGTLLVMYAFGFSINMVTLMAMSLCVGLLIDDAIVVRENIVRHLSMGKDHRTAAMEGTDEIGLAVMATTFAIVAVFIPIAFMSGIIGRFFFQFGMTVAVAVLVSLFISFTLDPMLSSVWHDPPGSRFSRIPWLDRFMARVERGIDAVHELYGRVLGWALGHRRSVIAIALVSFFGSFLVVPLVGTEFIPQADEGFISLRLNTPVGSSLEYTDGKVREVEQVLKEFPEISLAMTTVGTEDGRNYARVNLKLADRSERRRSQRDLEKAIRAALKPIPGVELAIGYDRPIWFNLLGPDPDTLARIAKAFADKVAKVPGIADLETSDKAANPALSIRLNNDVAADLGITVAQVGATIRPLVAGDTVSYWLAPDGQNYEVNVQLPKDSRRLVSDLGNLYVSTNRHGPDGQLRMVPLRQVAELVETSSPQIIKRQDLQRRIGIYANVEGRPSGDVGNDVQKIADEMQLPPGYRLAAAGQQQDMQESFQAALAALGLAVIFIYLILASQFASFTQPAAIMASLPFSLIGVLLALLLTRTTLNIFSIIGFIMLMGLVTKNAILLVDFANRARRAGASLDDALRDAGQVRLRPILMTTAAMIGGMLPLALGLGEGGETQAPMGRAIIGGVITSTLLTLVVVPVLYAYLDRWHEARRARRARKAERLAAEASQHARGGSAAD